MVFVDQVDAIRHANHNHQRRNQAGHQAQLVIEQHDAAHTPHHPNAHNHHADGHDQEVAEEEEEQQGRDQKSSADEVADFLLHLVGHLHPDERKSAQVQGRSVRFGPLIGQGGDIFHDGASAIRIEEFRIHEDRHQRRRLILIIQQAFVERQLKQPGVKSIRFLLCQSLCPRRIPKQWSE